MTDVSRYPVQIFPSDEDQGFIAVATDLPGCSAFGSTKEEALAQSQDAIQAWIEAAEQAGNPIPEPSSPALQAQHSGKVLLRMPRELHGCLTSAAKAQDVSLNHFIVYLITWAMANRSACTAHVTSQEGVFIGGGGGVEFQTNAVSGGYLIAGTAGSYPLFDESHYSGAVRPVIDYCGVIATGQLNVPFFAEVGALNIANTASKVLLIGAFSAPEQTASTVAFQSTDEEKTLRQPHG